MIDLVTIFDNLKFHQRSEIDNLIKRFIEQNKLNPISLNKNIICPHCRSDKYVKNGITCGRQRYKCKSCSRTYSQSTLTSVHKLQKVGEWTDFIYLMFSSSTPLTLEQLSRKLKISTKTVHTWKHKLLSSLNKSDDIKLSGEIEMDEVFLPFNVKGMKGKEKTQEILRIEEKHMLDKKNSMFLCIHNRDNDFDFRPIKIQQKGQVKSTDIGKVVEDLIIVKGTTVITDMSKGSTKYFKTREDITHEVFKSDGKKTKKLHNNNINNTMALYKAWSKNFNGYSTKYIWNYLKWFRYVRKFTQSTKMDYLVLKSINDKESNKRFNNIPMYYEEFLKTAS